MKKKNANEKRSPSEKVKPTGNKSNSTARGIRSKKGSKLNEDGFDRTNEPVEEAFYASALYDFLYPLRPVGNQWVAQYIIILFALIIRAAVGLGPYSGYNTPPLYGDFEAQRHWMEITQYLPISQWYWFDLDYWGLDYPPLTAYHSYILGKLGGFFYPPWFTLNESRGIETDGIKTYMRLTVLLSEALIYIPAIFSFTKWIGKYRRQSPIGQYMAAAAILFQPALMLIDHGHFQYNSVMLGLMVYAVNYLLEESYCLAALYFVLSICFKQMALYYSPIIFAYLLSRSLFYPKLFNVPMLASIGVTTIATFATIFAPLYLFGGNDNLGNVLQAIRRIFPFSRGIFEDKVANFWCVTNVLYKYKLMFTQEQLQFYSLIATAAGFLPAMLMTLIYPRKTVLIYSLIACSMSFFLFSFQVHEKTILLPLLPATLLYTSSKWDVLSMASWINNVGLFTLWPLLKKDGLILQYGVLLFLSNWLIGNFSFITPKFLPKVLTPGPSISTVAKNYHHRSLLPNNILWKIIIVTSYIVMGIIHILDLFVAPPERYPDIWVLANCALGFGCFVLFWFWSYYKLFAVRKQSIRDL